MSRRSSIIGSGLVATLLLGCGGRALEPGGLAGAAGSLGTTGSAGAAGAAGNVGTSAAGATGAAGAMMAPRPLPISSKQALLRIAAVLWDQLPDDALLARLPASGATVDQLAAVTRSMLEDPRAAVGVGGFYRWWLDLDQLATTMKDPALFPAFTPELAADMANETETFGVKVTLQVDGTFTTLMTAPISFLNARLAGLYGVPVGPDAPDGSLQMVMLPSPRAGLLTQPALLALGAFATRTSPSHRGSNIARQFFCDTIPAMPPGVPPLTASPGMTLRQSLATDLGVASCAACHGLIDPPGLALESFDAIGRTRTLDNGAPIDTSNLTIILPPSSSPKTSVVVNGPVDLATALALDPGTQTCMARQWLTFALGRDLGGADDPSVQQAFAQFQAAGFNLKALIVAVLTSDTFLTPN